MTEISIRNENFRTTILSLHNQSIGSSKLRFISPEVVFIFYFEEMEKPYAEILSSCFRVQLCQ